MFTKGEWFKEGNRVFAYGSGTVAICPSPTKNEGVFEFQANAQLIALSPRMAEWLTKVAKQDFVVFPEDKTIAREILDSLEEK